MQAAVGGILAELVTAFVTQAAGENASAIAGDGADASTPTTTTATTTGAVRFQATTGGMMTAYVSILVMSILPIIFGSFKSAENQRNSKETGEHTEAMSAKDAMMFPLIASGALFGLYLVFKIFGTQHVNMLLTFYFFLIGVLALAHVSAPILRLVLSERLVRNEEYHVHMRRRKADDMMFDLAFDHFDLIALVLACAFGVWYLLKKHWIANNIFGLAFAHNGIELLQLNSVATGCILLGGLFVYDVFWVFGTDVMVTVAKSFEAPIKLLFPQDFLEAGVWGKHHAMLGLGDIVIPGIFIALLLRFDLSKGSGSKLYFIVSFISYIIGLVVTVFVMTVFKHAQPALLYLVPMCVGAPLLVALLMGEIKELFLYRDNPEDEVVGGDDHSQPSANAAAGAKDLKSKQQQQQPHQQQRKDEKAGTAAATASVAANGEKNGVATRSKAKKEN